MKKGDLVTHGVWWSRTQRVEAIVRAVHRDGSVTVEDRFTLDAAGNRRGCYINNKQRIAADDCRAVA